MVYEGLFILHYFNSSPIVTIPILCHPAMVIDVLRACRFNWCIVSLNPRAESTMSYCSGGISWNVAGRI